MDHRVRRTIDYLEANGFGPVDCRFLAGRVGLSPSRLAHLFKEDAGVSIRSWIQMLRLRRAAELMITTDQRISEILYAVGFTDFSNFDHAFRRAFALSPREYRMRWRDDLPLRRGIIAPGGGPQRGPSAAAAQ